MNTDEVKQCLYSFCENWRPQRLSDEEIKKRLIREFREQDPLQDPIPSAYLQLLVNGTEKGVTRDEIYRTIWPKESTDTFIKKLNWTRSYVNKRLLQLRCNHLANYQVRIYPSPGANPNFNELLRIETLIPTTATSLAQWPTDSNTHWPNPDSKDVNRSVSRTDAILQPLHLAVAAYDAGRFPLAIHLFDQLMSSFPKTESILTLAETTQFLYGLAKTLLKLNWYETLDKFLSMPYQRFSDLMQNRLDTELLMIAGICYRQQRDAANANACFDSALNFLKNALESQPNEVKLFQNIADIYVLKSQVHLDQCLCVKSGPLSLEPNFALATECMKNAKENYREYWKGLALPTHYEGRLHGMQSFITVAQSQLFPEQVSSKHWEEAEKNARSGFEPANQRKPFGIVAGKYALSIVWLAKGMWLLNQLKKNDEAIRTFEKALRLLSSVFNNIHSDLENPLANEVYLGPKYELPKVEKTILILQDILANLGSTNQSLLDSVKFNEQRKTELEANTQICIYSPLV